MQIAWFMRKKMAAYVALTSVKWHKWCHNVLFSFSRSSFCHDSVSFSHKIAFGLHLISEVKEKNPFVDQSSSEDIQVSVFWIFI